MQIPLRPKHPLKDKIGHCRYRDCGKEFTGSPIRRYCDFHKNMHNRIREKPVYIDHCNQIVRHTFTEETHLLFKCALPGCGKIYEIVTHPGEFLYPKYCENHRNDFRRKQFAKMHGLVAA